MYTIFILVLKFNLRHYGRRSPLLQNKGLKKYNFQLEICKFNLVFFAEAGLRVNVHDSRPAVPVRITRGSPISTKIKYLI